MSNQKAKKPKPKVPIIEINSPSSGFTKPALVQSKSACGTVSILLGCSSTEGLSSAGFAPPSAGFNGSIGLKLKFAAKRGTFDEELH